MVYGRYFFLIIYILYCLLLVLTLSYKIIKLCTSHMLDIITCFYKCFINDHIGSMVLLIKTVNRFIKIFIRWCYELNFMRIFFNTFNCFFFLLFKQYCSLRVISVESILLFKYNTD